MVKWFVMDEIFHKGEKLPDRYRHPGFWLVRLVIAVFGGGVAVAYKVQNPVAALQIGASAPLIYKALAKGYKA